MTHIYTRAQWGARTARPMSRQGAPLHAFLHHSDDANGQAYRTLTTQKAHMRELQNFHMGPEREWSDIAYHFIVFQYVGVKELRVEPRAFTGRLTAFEPAAQLGYNMNTLAICVVANGDHEPLHTETMKLIAELIRKFPTVRDLRPHSANPAHPGETDCPGTRFRPHVKDIARFAGVTAL